MDEFNPTSTNTQSMDNYALINCAISFGVLHFVCPLFIWYFDEWSWNMRDRDLAPCETFSIGLEPLGHTMTIIMSKISSIGVTSYLLNETRSFCIDVFDENIHVPWLTIWSSRSNCFTIDCMALFVLERKRTTFHWGHASIHLPIILNTFSQSSEACALLCHSLPLHQQSTIHNTDILIG